MTALKIGYFADGPWAHKTFERIINDDTIKIDFICVRFDNKDSVLVSQAKTYGIDILIHKNINSQDFFNKVQEYNSDLFVSMSFDQIFKGPIINLPRLKTINCHAGKLPFFRGRNVLNWVLINDEREFGITVHYIDEGIDTGDIIMQKILKLTDEDNYDTILQRAYVGCSEVLYDSIKLIQSGKVETTKQNEIDPVGTYFGKRIEGDEIIDWHQSSREIFNFVRALCIPGPQACSYISGNIIKINKVKMIIGSHQYINTVGQVIGKSEKGYFVKTADTMIEVIEYTYDGEIRIGDRLTTKLLR